MPKLNSLRPAPSGKTAPSPTESREVVMAYIGALDSQNYDEALNCLDAEVRIKGPAGETFGKPREFVNMLRKHQGKYDVKKVFSDGNDVCVLYDLATSRAVVLMFSWYEVKHGKIISVNTIFDPGAFGPTAQ